MFTRKGRGFPDNGFEDQGGYFNAKLAKLNEQFNLNDTIEKVDGIFKGVSIYINGLTDPPEPELRELFIQYGGVIHTYLSSRTNFVVAANLPQVKIKPLGSKTLTPKWIVDSVAAGVKLQTYKYLLYRDNQLINFTETGKTSKGTKKIEFVDFEDDSNSKGVEEGKKKVIFWRDFSSSKAGKPPDGWKGPSIPSKSATKNTYPALNGITDIPTIRDLIRNAIANHPSPSPSDIQSINEFFIATFESGYNTNCHRLLKFIYRKSLERNTNQVWKTALEGIIAQVQYKSKEKYNGVFCLEDS